MRLFALFVFVILTTSASGQLVLTPIHKEVTKPAATNKRTEDITPLSLPFWDDFATIKNGVANANLWQYANSVWINSGLGINPPSLNVATFDGLDSLGKPYSVNDVLAKGFADKMVSAPLKLDEVAVANRTNVAITFFYQFKGRGEAPDAGDLLSLHFKNNLGVWSQVWSIENNGTLAADQFIRVTIPITGAEYFHDAFQFRFQNFARLSGPYDTWHVDYVYVSNGKSQVAPVFPLFPDRTVSQPLTSLFQNYRAVPIKHFFNDPAVVLKNPSLKITTLRTDQIPPDDDQPVGYSSQVTITSYENEVQSVSLTPLDVNTGTIRVPYGQFPTMTIQTLPDPTSLNPTADSTFIELRVVITSADDIPKPIAEADYDTPVFAPIKFVSNDTTRATYALSNYYAYDDGEAEYGAGLNKAGAQVAYRFDMLTTEPDTIVAIDFYFPRFGDESSQSIQLQIWKNLTSSTSDILHTGTVPIQRNSFNKFWRVTLPEPISVRDFFHIGWRQLGSALIAVGLDKNTEVPGKIFVNLNGAWEEDELAGSLMIRPVFGKGNGEVISGVPETKTIRAYPNPNAGVFYAAGDLNQIQLLDLTGKPLSIETESQQDETRITVVTPVAGIYVLRARQGNQVVTQKIVIR